MAERIDILVAARNATSGAINAIKAEFAGIGKAAGDASRDATSALKNIDSAANALSGGLAGLGAAAFGIGSVVGILQSIGEEMSELGRRGAVVGQLKDVFQDYAASVGSSTDAILSAMKKASQGTIAESELILNANRAIQFQVAQTPQALAQLVELSSALGRAQGISDQEALGFLTTGIARESRLILDNLGLIVDLEGATAAYAATLGKAASDLTQVERKQAILNEAYRQGEIALKANRDAADSPATRIERFDAAQQDLRENIGEATALAFSDSIASLSTDVQQLTDFLFRGGEQADTLAERLKQLRIERDRIAKAGPVEILGVNLSEQVGELGRLNVLIADYEKRLKAVREASSRQSAVVAPELPISGKRQLAQALAGEDVPAIIDNVVDSLEKLRTDAPDVLATRITNLRDSFDDLGKIQGAIKSSITGNAVKLSDIIGDERSFALATQQIEEFDAKLKELTSQALTGELDPGEFLFKLQTLPSQATEIFGQVTAAAKDGGEKLRAELANLVNLEDVFRSGGNTAGADLLAGQIRELQSVLAIVAPAAQNAATGLGALGNAAVTADSQLASIVTNAGGAGSAAVSLGASAGNAANEVYVLNAALAGAPPALAAAGAAMIAAGSDALTTAAAVGRLRDEFNALSGAQAGARRAIIQRAAGVADIVGPQKALALANQEIAKSEAAYKGLEQGLLAAGDGSLQFEFDLALLGTTTTSTFDEIEEADRKAKQLATQGLKAASSAANDAEQAFDSLKGKVAGVLSGALNLDVGVDTESILGREDAINEDARRLADVAVKGFDSPWAQYLADKFPDTIGAAFDGADPKKAAAQLLRDFEDGLRPELLDKERAKERVRRALVGEQNMAALAQEIAAELSAEFGGSINLGRIQAVAGTTLGVDGAETDQLARTLSGAASGVQQQLAGLGGSVKSGILAALEGIGEAVTGALDKQFRSEGNLKTMREAGGTNGEAWGSGFLAKVGDNVPPKLVEILASLVTPSVEALLNRNASLQGAN